MKFIRIILIFFILSIGCTTAVAQNEITQESSFTASNLEKYRQLFWDSLPAPLSWTNDYAWLFSTLQRNQLDSIIGDFEKKTTIEVCVVTLDTFCVSKEKFDSLALHIGRTWGVGKKGKNNGILVCISPGYRKIRIENGYGIEKYLSDKETKDIIDFTFVPQFKNGAFFEGTKAGINAVILKLTDKINH
jgi:uncharacterized protein